MPVDIDQTVAHLRARDAARRERAARRAKGLRALIPEAARMVRDRFGAKRVWVFGSLATGEVHEASDVDLAVERMVAAVYFEALSSLMQHFPCDVDLVRLEEAPDSLRDRVREQGVAA